MIVRICPARMLRRCHTVPSHTISGVIGLAERVLVCLHGISANSFALCSCPPACRYFANLIEQRLGPNDNVIIITHEPTWLLEWFWASSSSSNLRQLVRGHLRGRARVHLAGGSVSAGGGGGGLTQAQGDFVTKNGV
jgi:hypothetical protein